jgi:hypothetical protein
MQNILLIAIGLMLISLVLLFYTRTRTRIEIKMHPMPIPAIKRPSQSMNDHASYVDDPSRMNEDSLLEEAELYANLGLPQTSVKILKEILQLHSSNPSAWFLLLSCYSSLGDAVEFDRAARKFLRQHPYSQLWSRIQALGRTLDQHNPLYINNTNSVSGFAKLTIATEKARSIGEILKEAGILTDLILQHQLSKFNRKNHGRFGGFLLKNKVITLTQLNQALMLQQSVHA